MKEWSDDELDKLFQKSAEELNPMYEPNDWNDLRRRLDGQDGIPGSGWLKKAALGLIALLLVLVGGVGLYYGIEANTIDPAPSAKAPSASDEKGSGPGTNASTGNSHEERIPNQPNAASEPEGTDERTPGTLSAKKMDQKLKRDDSRAGANPSGQNPVRELPPNLGNVSGVREQGTLKRRKGAILLSQKADTRPAKRPEGTSVAKDDLPNLVENESLTRSVPLKNSTRPVLSQNKPLGENPQGEEGADRLGRNSYEVTALPSRPTYRPGTVLAYPPVAYAEPEVPDAPSAAVPVAKWAIRIGVSPDVSSVKASDMMQAPRARSATSLLGEYALGERWIVQSGVIRSLKSYSASMDKYRWPASWNGKQKQMPESIDGTCSVIEIPLNVRYDLRARPAARWFVGAGVSSYKMQKEKYLYHYKYPNDPGIRWKGWKGATGWYFLSHANVSVGYERALTRRFSLLAEPYARIPLRGVGFGKVNLFTTGIWVSLRYVPVFQKQE